MPGVQCSRRELGNPNPGNKDANSNNKSALLDRALYMFISRVNKSLSEHCNRLCLVGLGLLLLKRDCHAQHPNLTSMGLLGLVEMMHEAVPVSINDSSSIT